MGLSHGRLIGTIVWCASLVLSPALQAATVKVAINYPGQTPTFLNSAFVYLVPDEATKVQRTPRTAEVIQAGKLFHPYSQAIQVGDSLLFPNRDTVSHHVYSFSPAKVFELPLYSAERNPPQVMFERTGLVVLGCNIHDWMLAFVLVVDTPWVQRVKENAVVFEGLPEGMYSLYCWYPSTKTSTQVMGTVDVRGDVPITLDLLAKPALLEQPQPPPRRPGRREEY